MTSFVKQFDPIANGYVNHNVGALPVNDVQLPNEYVKSVALIHSLNKPLGIDVNDVQL